MESTKKKSNVKDMLLNNAIYIVLLFLFLGIVAVEPKFLSARTFFNILDQSSTRVIMALGVGSIIIAKGTDLSLGRQVGLAAVVSASLLQAPDYAYRMYPDLPQLNIMIPLLAVILITVTLSAVNGIVVSKFHVDPFVATLGMMIIVFGLNSTYFDRPPYGAQPIGGLDPAYLNLGQGKVFGSVSWLAVFAIIITLIMWVIWNKTKFGKNIFAIGGNIEAAKVSGVNVVLYTIAVFALAGILYGIGGYLEAARIGTATNNTGNMYELDAIAACIVGGLSFNGGIGSISGIVVGVLIFQVIAYGLTYIGVNPYMQLIIKGLIIIIAVAIDSRKNAVKK